ncbi:MAG: hypothetical protein ACRD3C_26340 [Vicinamibacterales bacterium]
MRPATVCALTLAYCMSQAVLASATVLLPADFPTVVAESGLIVRGRVADVTSSLAGPRHTIESLVTVNVIESYKGASGATVIFRVPNGQVGRYRRIIVGAPEFERGDEVVVFLRGRAPAIPTLFGLSQGVYRVMRDAAARAVVVPVPVAAQGPGTERVVRGDPMRRPVPVETFAREVRALLERNR